MSAVAIRSRPHRPLPCRHPPRHSYPLRHPERSLCTCRCYAMRSTSCRRTCDSGRRLWKRKTGRRRRSTYEASRYNHDRFTTHHPRAPPLSPLELGLHRRTCGTRWLGTARADPASPSTVHCWKQRLRQTQYRCTRARCCRRHGRQSSAGRQLAKARVQLRQNRSLQRKEWTQPARRDQPELP